jgi:hypothetical protein
MNDPAGYKSADCRNDKAPPQWQFSETFNKPRCAAAREDFVNECCDDAIRDRANGSAKPDDTGPNQRDLKFGWSRPFLNPNPEFEAAQRL